MNSTQNKKKRILFLEQYSKISGGQRVLLKIIDGMDKALYDIFVIVPDLGDLTGKLEKRNIEYIKLNIGYYSVSYKTLFDIFVYILRVPHLVINTLKIIKEKQIDLVYANAARTFVWGTLACFFSKKPMVWHVHSIFNKGLVRGLCLYFGSFSAVKKIITVSRACAKPLLVLQNKIEVVYNGIDINKFHPEDNINKFRREIGCTDETILVAAVGLLLPWKNQEDLIKAAKLVLDQLRGKVKFLIIGDSLYNDKKGQDYKKKLKGLVVQLKLQDHVIFTGHRLDTAQIMRQLDMITLTSKTPDPCPLVMLEAMASAVPVIATDFGGPAEIIENEKDGMLYPAGDYNKLAKIIRHLAENKKIKINMGKKALEKIRKGYTEKIYLKKINNIIEVHVE